MHSYIFFFYFVIFIGPNLHKNNVGLSNPSPFHENYTKLYFDVKHLKNKFEYYIQDIYIYICVCVRARVCVCDALRDLLPNA